MKQGRIALVLLILALSLLQILPNLWDYANTPPGYQYTGLLEGGEDYFTYITKMRLGFEGAWLYENRYTAEPTPHTLIFSFYIFLGHLCRLLHLPLWLGFHLARWILYPVVLTLLWHLLGRLHLERGRLMALFLAAGASGFGYVLASHKLWTAETLLTIHLYQAAMFPHYLANTAAVLGFFLLAFRFVEQPAWYTLAGACLLLNLLVLIHPYMVAIAVGVPALYWVIAQRERSRVWLIYLAVTTLAVLPLLGYMALTLLGHGTLSDWRQQALGWTPPFWVQLVWLGLSQPLAFAGLWYGLRQATRPVAFWLTWIALAYLFINWNPLHNSVEFGIGLSIPVGVLAAMGFLQLRERLKLRPALTVIAVACLVPGFLLASAAFALPIRGPRELHSVFYLPADYLAGLQWLGSHADDETVVLGSRQTGNLIPAYAPVRVYWGHPSETYRSKEKLQLAQRFYTGHMANAEAEQFLRSSHVRYVVQDDYLVLPDMVKAPAWVPDLSPYTFLQAVYQSKSLTVYAVNLD